MITIIKGDHMKDINKQDCIHNCIKTLNIIYNMNIDIS